MTQPIDFYYWTTPNGWKVSIMLEEVGLPYTVHPINIMAGDQFDPDFLTISPNNKIPAIVDPNGPGDQPISLFESGAILMYLGEKTGQFYPTAMGDRYRVMTWLMFQMGSIGPMFGQAHHFRKYAPEKIPYAIDRYTNEAGRLYGVLDNRLSRAEYITGEDYTIADIAIFPWTISHETQGHSFDGYPNVKRWFDTINARPAVQRGLALLKEKQSNAKMDETSWETMFGSKQYGNR